MTVVSLPDDGANDALASSSCEDGTLGPFGEDDEETADPCSVASLVRNFTALLNDMDYRPALDILGVKPMQFNRRKLLKREFRALYIGLWRLALLRSFPTRHAELFQSFMESEGGRCKDRRQAAASAELVLQYVGKLSEHGDADFSGVARHILSLLEFDETQTRAMVLKLALHLRRVYTHFFDHLL